MSMSLDVKLREIKASGSTKLPFETYLTWKAGAHVKSSHVQDNLGLWDPSSLAPARPSLSVFKRGIDISNMHPIRRYISKD